MIYATDRSKEFTTYWHVLPPAPGHVFVVGQQEWNQTGDHVFRHIMSWCYPDPPPVDEQGWMPVPHWRRAGAGEWGW